MPTLVIRPRWWGQLAITLCLLGGCAQTGRTPWAFGARSVKESPGPNTLAGQVAAVRAETARAKSLSPAESRQIIERWKQELARSPGVPVRTAMVAGSPAFPPELALPLLEITRRDPETEVRAATCDALGRIADAEAMDLLIAIMEEDEDTDVRLAAARGLGHYRDPQAIAALGTLLDDRDPAVQYLAMQSLRQVSGADGGHDVRKWRELVGHAPTRLASEPKTQR